MHEIAHHVARVAPGGLGSPVEVLLLRILTNMRGTLVIQRNVKPSDTNPICNIYIHEFPKAQYKMLWKRPKYTATGGLLEALNPKPYLNKFQDHLRQFGEARVRRSSGFGVEGSEV